VPAQKDVEWAQDNFSVDGDSIGIDLDSVPTTSSRNAAFGSVPVHPSPSESEQLREPVVVDADPNSYWVAGAIPQIDDSDRAWLGEIHEIEDAYTPLYAAPANPHLQTPLQEYDDDEGADEEEEESEEEEEESNYDSIGVQRSAAPPTLQRVATISARGSSSWKDANPAQPVAPPDLSLAPATVLAPLPPLPKLPRTHVLPPLPKLSRTPQSPKQVQDFSYATDSSEAPSPPVARVKRSQHTEHTERTRQMISEEIADAASSPNPRARRQNNRPIISDEFPTASSSSKSRPHQNVKVGISPDADLVKMGGGEHFDFGAPPRNCMAVDTPVESSLVYLNVKERAMPLNHSLLTVGIGGLV
jgi:ribosomal protein L12E/L44/L45/RPP1/RPP2